MLKLIFLMSIVFNFALAQKSDFSLAEARLMKEEAMRLWQRRDDQSSLEQSLSNFEKVHQVNTQDLEILTYLARGYYLLADLHLDNEALKMKNFETARLFGELGLMLNPHYRKLIKDNTEMAIDKLTEKEAPILFWTAASLGKWAKLYGIMSSLKYKAQIILMIKKAEQLKPEYFYGAIPRYWGEYYAAIPAIFGTNSEIEKSQKYFKKAMDAAPEYLGTKNLYAQFYLVKKEDKRGFRKTMEEVLKAPNGPIEITPENLLEKLRADKLLEKMDDLF